MLDEPPSSLVAVIEDDAVSRSALGRLLQAGGFEPALFSSAETFIARLRSEGCEVPIIITTGDRADMIRERAQQAGCTAFLLKPFSGDMILPFLRSLPHH